MSKAKFYISIMFFIISSVVLSAQSYRATLNLGGQYGIKKATSSRDSFMNTYTIDVTRIENDFVQIVIETIDAKKRMFKLKPFNYELFKSKLLVELSGLIKDTEDLELSPISILKENGEIYFSSLFGKIVSSFSTNSGKPVIAELTLLENIKIRYDDKCEGVDLDEDDMPIELENTKVEMSFFDGFIEKIEVTGYHSGEKIVFTNKFSIGITSVSNLKRMRNIKLFSIGKYKPDAGEEIPIRSQIYGKGCRLYVYLGNVIDYDREVDVNANDISPVNQKVLLNRGQSSVFLFKEETKKILEAIVYSDLFGVFDEENPNGIIQTEIKKRFNLNTAKIPIFSTIGFGFFEYFDLDFRISKLEDNNRYLQLSSFYASGMQDTVNYSSLIDLYRYQNFSFGGLYNLVSLESQDSKLMTQLDMGFNFGRSGVLLGREQFNVNTLQVPIFWSLRFVPEKRFNFNINTELRYLRLLSDEDFRTGSVTNGAFRKGGEWLYTTSLLGALNISDNGKLFVRYNFTHNFGKLRDNFSTFQFGYSFYLLDD